MTPGCSLQIKNPQSLVNQEWCGANPICLWAMFISHGIYGLLINNFKNIEGGILFSVPCVSALKTSSAVIPSIQKRRSFKYNCLLNPKSNQLRMEMSSFRCGDSRLDWAMPHSVLSCLNYDVTWGVFFPEFSLVSTHDSFCKKSIFQVGWDSSWFVACSNQKCQFSIILPKLLSSSEKRW